ncbi:MAG: glycosyltransferase [Lachnospiraceae bacterium]|nr:glycosyltransferase [Lachnospiraceae bacterium]
MKVLQINATDFFSTGNIMLQIAEVGRKNGIEMYTAAKKTATSVRKGVPTDYHYLIGNRYEHAVNRLFSSLTDLQDSGSVIATLNFINYIKKISPDIIHIHDIAGYYLNLKLFFDFLKRYNKPVIWTLHCCWAYTGRCIHYDYIGCKEWQKSCKGCAQPRKQFPKHLTLNLSSYNFNKKKKLVTELGTLYVVAISKWMEQEARKSYLQRFPILTIYDGIDLNQFFPEPNHLLLKKYNLVGKKIILGVASAWSERKGLKYFVELRKQLHRDFAMVLIGLSEEQQKKLPDNIIGLRTTFDIQELRNWYSDADVFVNPTLEEGLGLVNIEAQACGTPVVTFATGGAIETISVDSGKVVGKGDVDALKSSILEVISSGKDYYMEACINQARNFKKEDKYHEYIELYKEIYANGVKK